MCVCGTGLRADPLQARSLSRTDSGAAVACGCEGEGGVSGEGGEEGRRDGARERGREGGTEGGTEGRREGGTEGRREGGTEREGRRCFCRCAQHAVNDALSSASSE